MKYASIDTETTGLNPINDLVLEIGIVIDDTDWWDKDVESSADLPTFQCYIDHGRFYGDAFALGMNGHILTKIAKKEGNVLSPEDAVLSMNSFLKQHFTDKAWCCGKNFASFDRPFIEQLAQRANMKAPFHHRSFDPAALFLLPEDTGFPALSKCLERSGINSPVTHNAVDDAFQVVQITRYGMKKLWGSHAN